jgi:hypothetical protein
MRVVVIVVTMLVVTSPALASESCMSKAEARQHFPAAHIYWHGSDHCWDAMAAQRHQIHSVQRGGPIREAEREPDQPKNPSKNPSKNSAENQTGNQSNFNQSNWRDSMSEMLPDDTSAQPSGTSSQVRDATDVAGAGAIWADRWVDIAALPFVARWVDIPQSASRPMAEADAELSAAPTGLVVVCIAFVLMIGTIEMMFGGTIFERRAGEVRVLDESQAWAE